MDQLRYFVFFMCAFCPSSYQPACNHHSSAASNYITYTMSKTGIKLLELGQVIVMLLITSAKEKNVNMFNTHEKSNCRDHTLLGVIQSSCY